MAICLKSAREGRNVEELEASACSPDAQLHLSMSEFKVSDYQMRSTGETHHFVCLARDSLGNRALGREGHSSVAHFRLLHFHLSWANFAAINVCSWHNEFA